MPCLFVQRRVFYKAFIASLIFMGGAMSLSGPLAAQSAPEPRVKMQTEGAHRYIASNGLSASGAAGAAAQDHVFRMALKPTKKEKPVGVPATMFFGVALDGVPFKSAPKDDPSVDAGGGALIEGAVYVYAKAPLALLNKDLSHLGYAADGFPVFYSRKNLFTSGYDDKGAFAQGRGNLDRCNGITVNDKHYIYVLTDSYPHIPLCWSGAPDRAFVMAGAQDINSARGPVKMPGEPSGADGVLKPVPMSQEAFIEQNRKQRAHLHHR
jgi:hypothetical protein